jgi:hypothetical protein
LVVVEAEELLLIRLNPKVAVLGALVVLERHQLFL